MKHRFCGMLAFLLLIVGVQQAAFATPPFYQQVCRSDDPFLYCTKGCKETKAWKPRAPYTNPLAYTPQLGYCPVPVVQTGSCPFDVKPYLIFMGWGQRDYNDYTQNYVVVCPQAHQDGKWEGQGRPENTPFNH